MPHNYPKIDKFENGVATSIKSIDLSAPSYQTTARLESKLKSYVDDVAGFNGRGRWGNAPAIEPGMIQHRELLVAIPGGGTRAQHDAMVNAFQHGQGIDVNVMYVVVR